MAPDWRSPTEDNGAFVARADLHIALIAESDEARKLLARTKVVRPPLWNGKIHLHILTNTGLTEDEVLVQQAIVDLGWADSRDLQIGPPDSITDGYPSGTKE